MSNPHIKNSAVAELIAARLFSGLPHPGDAEKHVPATLVKLPGFNTTGMSAAQAAEFVGDLAQQLGEAVVYLIETEGACQIVGSVFVDNQKAVIADLESRLAAALQDKQDFIADVEAQLAKLVS